MSDFPNDIVLEHTKNIATLKADVSNLKDRMEDMSEIRNAVVKLTVLQEEQAKFSSDVSETLKVMNENLNILNTEAKDTNKRVGKLEIKVDEIDDRGNFNWIKMVKDWLPKLIVSGIIYYFIQLADVLK